MCLISLMAHFSVQQPLHHTPVPGLCRGNQRLPIRLPQLLITLLVVREQMLLLSMPDSFLSKSLSSTNFLAKVFGLTLEFRNFFVTKTVVIETASQYLSLTIRVA